MKIRNGFVSNSSSSSFVLGKAYMTDEQIKFFSSKLEEIENEESYIHETKYYFQGEVGHFGSDVLNILVESLGLTEYVSIVS